MKNLNYAFLLSFFTSNSIYATSDLGKIYNLSEDVRNVIVSTEEYKEVRTTDFRKSADSTDKIMAIVKLDKEVEAYAKSNSKDCDETEKKEKEQLAKKIDGRDYIIYFTGVYDANSEDRALSYFKVDTYRNFMVGQYNSGKLGSTSLYDYNNLIKEVQKKNSDYSTLNVKEKIERINQYAIENLKIEIPKDLLTEESLRIELIRNPSNWKENLSLAKDNLDFEQKMRIAARMGGVFLNNYNYARVNANDGTKISVEQMLEAARTNQPGGICRDVSAAQAQMLKELGVDPKSIYQIGYDSSQGGHAVLAVQDPNNKNRIIKLNYNEMTQESQVKGVGALKQDTQLPDVGMNFRVYDVDSKPIANLPTEIGQMLRDVTTAKEPLIESKPYSISKIGARTPYGNLAVFTGTTSTGDKVVGGAIDKAWDSKYSRIEVGAAFAQKETDSPIVKMDQDIIYLRFKEQLYTPEFNVGKVVSKADFGIAGEIFSSKQKGSAEGYAFDTSTLARNLEVETGLTSVYKYSPTTKITGDIRAYGYLDWEDEQASDKLTIAYDRTEANLKVEKEFDDIEILARTGIVARRIGKSYFVGGGVKVKDTDTIVYSNFSKPIGEVPAFMPESSKRFIIGGAQKVGDLNMSLEYKKDLEIKEDIFFLNAEYKF